MITRHLLLPNAHEQLLLASVFFGRLIVRELLPCRWQRVGSAIVSSTAHVIDRIQQRMWWIKPTATQPRSFSSKGRKQHLRGCSTFLSCEKRVRFVFSGCEVHPVQHAKHHGSCKSCQGSMKGSTKKGATKILGLKLASTWTASALMWLL